MNVRFERAFDDLIASHDVSDDAIDRLYDGTPEVVTQIDISYGLLCGNVAPEDMSGFLSRADERRKESAHKAEKYRRMFQEQERIQARVEAEVKRQRNGRAHPEPDLRMAFDFARPVSHAPKPQREIITPQEIIDKVIPEFAKIVAYAERRIGDIERTIDDAGITAAITGLPLDDARNAAICCLRALKDNFLGPTSDGWVDVVSNIESGEITTTQTAIDYARMYMSNARRAAQQYDNLLRYRTNKAKDMACGSMDAKYSIYYQYKALNLRIKQKPTLYVMKIMCETIGNSTAYNDHSGVLTIPIGKDVQYSPLSFHAMTPQDYQCPLAVTWAVNTISDSTSRTISCRYVNGYYNECLNSSDMLYVGHGMHLLSASNGNIKPALVYEFHPMSTFAKSCRIIYANEKEMKLQGAADPSAHEFYMKHYFHERNVRYAGFNPNAESWEDLADDIAKFSAQMLTKYKR